MAKNVNLEELLGDDESDPGSDKGKGSASTPPQKKQGTRSTGQRSKGQGQRSSHQRTTQASSEQASQSPRRAAPDTHPRRPSLTLTVEQDKDLKLARVEDDVETTTRIRAMIELWQTNQQFRKKVDQLAKQRTGEKLRGRPPRER